MLAKVALDRIEDFRVVIDREENWFGHGANLPLSPALRFHRGSDAHDPCAVASMSIVEVEMTNPVNRTARRNRRKQWALVYGLLVIALSAPLWSSAMRTAVSIFQPADSIRVPILVYHSIAPHHPGQSAEQRLLDVDTDVFKQQMNWLSGHRFNVIPLASLVDALDGKTTLPQRAVVITFDDGWGTQYRDALPVLRQLNYTATFFIVTSQIGHGPAYMTLDELRDLKGFGMTIAAHSRTHPLLTKLSPAALQDEVQGSKDDLQREMGIVPAFFAYPYGAWNPRAAAAVQAAGFQAARAYPGGAWNDPADRFALHSVLVTDDMNAFEREVGGQGAYAKRNDTPSYAIADMTRAMSGRRFALSQPR
jgi:peptidoglycan/xylan/chitin deacetylase (PgdA/CDA1 family)